MTFSPAARAWRSFGSTASKLSNNTSFRQFPPTETYPYKRRTIREARRKFEKVLILADDYKIVNLGVVEDLTIRRGLQGNVEHVLRNVAARLQKSRQSRRELMIDQESHATSSTV